jgi:hypothetical protein
MTARVHIRAAAAAALVLAGLLSAGCGAATKPHGRVVLNGQPYKADPGDMLRVTFFDEGEPGKQTSSVADVAPDGTFTLAGPTNTGIPPGKYHITVTTLSTAAPASTISGVPPSAPGGGDKFQGKYSDPAKTPLTCEVTTANPEIVIDVGKGTVSTGN